MGKGKPRHNPDKTQNKLGTVCRFAEFIPSFPKSGQTVHVHCMAGHSAKDCQGNPHRCSSAWYRWQACRSNRRKNLDEIY